MAQKYWTDGQNKIPKQLFEMEGLEDLVDCKLAVIGDDGVYAVGSEKQFQWIADKRNAGRRSAEIRKERRGTAQPEQCSTKPRTDLEQCSTIPEPLSLSLSPPLSLSLSLEPHIRKKPSKNLRASLSLTHTPFELDLAQRWVDHAMKYWPHLKPNRLEYAKALSQVKRSLQIQDDALNYLFEFICADDFWRDNCQSPAGLLRKSRNGVRKIDNILSNMRRHHAADIAGDDWVRSKNAELNGATR
jgi:hypothetical protein